jgi:hypothetical protein
MKAAQKLTLILSLIVAMAIPALAGVTVNSPVNSSSVSSPFTLSALATSCSSRNVSAMGYSFDNSPDTTIVNATAIETSVGAGSGSHTLHVKAWGDKGASCVTDVAITIGGSGGLSIPSNAISVGAIQAMGNWQSEKDSGTGSGSANGWMSMASSPSYGGSARKFSTSYSNYGGERYDISFGDDTSATNFLYDGWIYVARPSNSIANIEMDMNQVMQNGQTVIFGFQCDGWSSTWDYTKNAGTPEKPQDAWVHSGAYCNPRAWSTNTWHHVQVTYSRDDSGNVTYKSVWLDGVESGINATVPSAFALGWGPALLTNLQIDGATTGGSSSTVFMDDLVIYRW